MLSLDPEPFRSMEFTLSEFRMVNELQKALEKPFINPKNHKKMTKNEKILAAVKHAMCEKTMLTSTNIEAVIKQVSADLPPTTPWWVIVLKVLAYAIGLLLAGYGTVSAATMLMPWMR